MNSYKRIFGYFGKYKKYAILAPRFPGSSA